MTQLLVTSKFSDRIATHAQTVCICYTRHSGGNSFLLLPLVLGVDCGAPRLFFHYSLSLPPPHTRAAVCSAALTEWRLVGYFRLLPPASWTSYVFSLTFNIHAARMLPTVACVAKSQQLVPASSLL